MKRDDELIAAIPLNTELQPEILYSPKGDILQVTPPCANTDWQSYVVLNGQILAVFRYDMVTGVITDELGRSITPDQLGKRTAHIATSATPYTELYP